VTESELHRVLVIGVLATAGVVWLMLSFVTAPYGRHARSGWGASMPVRWAWVVMESPALFGFAAIYALGDRALSFVPLCLCAMWLTHYAYRTLVYPVVSYATSPARTPVVIVAMGFVFNAVNAYVNARQLSALGPALDSAWILDPRFTLGVLLFVLGLTTNRWADRILRGLRHPGETGYRIPRGGLYERVVSPNYLGEILQWAGWAIACWSLAGLAFAVFTAANLIPRARAHLRWYRAQFPGFPRDRRAIIPFVL